MKRLLFLLFLLLPVLSYAQDVKSAPLFLRYDVTQTGSPIWGKFLGQNGDPFGGPKSGPTQARIKTAGSSTTVVEETASTNPFTSVAVGDVLIVTIPATGAQANRLVTARASAASITVDSAIDLTAGSTFRLYTANRGTAATDGWVRVSSDREKTWSWEISTINATDIRVVIQCQDDYMGAPLVQSYPPVTSVTDTCFTGIFTTTKICKWQENAPYGQCRMGIFLTGDTGAQVFTAGYEGRKAGN